VSADERPVEAVYRNTCLIVSTVGDAGAGIRGPPQAVLRPKERYKFHALRLMHEVDQVNGIHHCRVIDDQPDAFTLQRCEIFLEEQLRTRSHRVNLSGRSGSRGIRDGPTTRHKKEQKQDHCEMSHHSPVVYTIGVGDIPHPAFQIVVSHVVEAQEFLTISCSGKK
jgi:hypothetical protein